MITPDINNQVCFLANCSTRDNPGSLRWLYGKRDDGTVKLINRLPSKGVDYSGALWKFNSTGDDGTFNISCLGDSQNSQHVYLEATGNDGAVSLDSDDTNTSKNAKWIIQQATDAKTLYYPQYPWDGMGELFTFLVKNSNASLESNLLYGNADTGEVSLQDNDNKENSGVHWLVLVPIILS